MYAVHSMNITMNTNKQYNSDQDMAGQDKTWRDKAQAAALESSIG